MLAHLLEKLLGDEEDSPQGRALRTLMMLALTVGMWLVFHKPDPTCAQKEQAVRAYTFRDIIKRKELSPRNEYELIIIRNFNQQIKTPDLRFFHTPAFCQQLDSASPASLPSDRRLAASLPIFARTGDSLIKFQGQLTIYVKRGNRSYPFEYRCL